MIFLDLLFPKRCLGCGSIGKYFCDRCARTIRVTREREMICPMCEKLAIDGGTHPRCRTRYSLDGLTSFFRYDGVVRKAIKAIKYRFVSDLAKEFVSLIPREFMNNITIKQYNNCFLVPIPLHPSRCRERGFNQANVLGKLLAHRLHIPIRTDILKRVKKTTPQVEMKDRKKRLKNMEGVFGVNHETMKQCNNVAMILFDDVFTTGATLRSGANVLKRAGAPFVWGITMAR